MKTKFSLLRILKGVMAGAVLLGIFLVFWPAVSHGAEYKLEDFLILVDDKLIIKGYADIICCGGTPRRSDLGSRNSAQIGGSGTTRIPTVAPTVVDVAIIAPNVTLGKHAQVSHIIYDMATGSYTDNCTTGCKGPTLLEDDMGLNSLNDTGIKDLPDFPAFPAFTAGAVDIIVPAGGTVNLPEGSYRDLIMGAHATVHFSFNVDGIYNFRRIIAGTASNYQLIFDDEGIQMNVEEFVRFAEYGSVNPTGMKGITLYVAGADGSYGGANKNALGVYGLPAAFMYNGDGSLQLCFVFVKNGTINVRGYSHPNFWRTQWFGKSFQQYSSLKITLKQTEPTEVCFQHRECACITDFKLRADGTLRVTGSNFSKQSLERLAIFSETYSDFLENVTQGNLGKDQTIANLTIVSPSAFVTNNDIATLLGPGSYLLGIMSPPTGNPSNYCIFREKLLVIP